VCCVETAELRRTRTDAGDGRAREGLATAADEPWLAELVASAALAGEDVLAALCLARLVGPRLPLPGQGRTTARWRVLRELGRTNLTVARVVEAHSDALAILAEAGVAAEPDATYGVFAAEGPGEPLRARTARSAGGGAVLVGTKPWCSLGSELDTALVTAHAEGGRRLFAVDLRDPRVVPEPTSGWVARGLRTVTSTSLRFDGAPAHPVGETGWYLTRPGFAWGGIGVAACWYGAALGLQDRLMASMRDQPDDLAAMHVGRVDVALYAAGAALRVAADAVDGGVAGGGAGSLLALRTRTIVAQAVELTLEQVGHALGPAPLAFDEDHARRAADLTIYVRQHHGERDVAALGRAVRSAS
jgi:alkylation response protein AidB-like acyl-CoA dehydrogenase